LTIDIDHIGDRQMSRFLQHAAAALAAIFIATTSIAGVVTVPADHAAVAAPTLA
jgi:hypothetical protein